MERHVEIIFPGRKVPGELKQMVFTVASLASGCAHYQPHGSHHLHKIGMPDEEIQALRSHVGEAHEQRKAHPITLGWTNK